MPADKIIGSKFPCTILGVEHFLNTDGVNLDCFVLAAHFTRLILAGARVGGADGKLGGGGERVDSSTVADLHLALSQALLLQGAFEEADRHALAAERLAIVERMKGVANGGSVLPTVNAALRLEIALLSRTPLVLESAERAISLRGELLAELERMGKEQTFWARFRVRLRQAYALGFWLPTRYEEG